MQALHLSLWIGCLDLIWCCTSFSVKFQLHLLYQYLDTLDTRQNVSLRALRECLLVFRMNFGLAISGLQFSRLHEVHFVTKV